MGYKAEIGMTCVTVIGVVHMLINGDGTVLTACIAAISALAGVSIGAELQKKVSTE